MKLLMCSPNHYQVNYSINPWMNPFLWNNDHYRKIARLQWTTLYEKLIKLGVEVHLMDQQPGCPDMVFTANGGFVLRGRTLTSNFHYAVRSKEQPYFLDVFKNLKDKGVVDSILDQKWLLERYDFEGAGDTIYDKKQNIIWFGSGFRSDKRFKERLSWAYDVPVYPLNLIDHRFYHLDTCFSVLTHGEVVFYPKAFDNESVDLISENATGWIKLSDAEARRFGANLICIDNHIILGAKLPNLRFKLENCGYKVHEIELDMFHKAGGSAACLVLRLDQ